VQGVQLCRRLGGLQLVLLAQVQLLAVVLVELAALAEVVSQHLLEEGLVLRVLASGDEFLVDHVDELLHALVEFGLHVALLALDLHAPLLVLRPEEVGGLFLREVVLLHVAQQFASLADLVLERTAEQVAVVVAERVAAFLVELTHEGLVHVVEFLCIFFVLVDRFDVIDFANIIISIHEWIIKVFSFSIFKFYMNSRRKSIICDFHECLQGGIRRPHLWGL